MKTIAFMLTKGGVGKTVSSVNFAYILGVIKKKRVLIVDVNPQGNISKTYGIREPEELTISDLLLNPEADINEAIYSTPYPTISIIPANAALAVANKKVLMETALEQQYRLKNHIEKVRSNFDYCIYDCSTEVTMATLNAFAMADEVLVPTRVDEYSLEAIPEVMKLIEDMKEYNPKLKLGGCFVTMYQRSGLAKDGIDFLMKQPQLRTFKTVIRNTIKVSESTHKQMPLMQYAPKCTAAQDYLTLVDEYLSRKK